MFNKINFIFLDIFKNILINENTINGVNLCLEIEKSLLKLHLKQLEE